MTKKIGFLGCGKIGQAMLAGLLKGGESKVTFIQDPCFRPSEGYQITVVKEQVKELLAETDLVIECATAAVLKENFDGIIAHCDLLMFSVTALADEAFAVHMKELALRTGHKVFLPHGAILGVDGIFDGRELLTSVSIETTKNPASLGRKDTVKSVVYEGTTREACRLYPRNVNVHATVALAGLGFDKTHSVIICDPAVNTNTHKIVLEGKGIHFELLISSFTTGGVTGKYTPYSACGSLERILNNSKDIFRFV